MDSSSPVVYHLKSTGNMNIKDNIKSVLSLSFSLAKANFKLRNEGSYLGIFWYLLEPIAFFVILLFIGGIISVNNIKDYPVYLFLGLILFNFFSATTSYATNSIRNNASFIKSLKIHKEVFVLSGLFQFTFSHFLEFLILIGFSIFFNISITWIFLYPVVFVLFLMFTAGICFILAVIGVYVNDLKNVWSVITRLLWFATPIFYVVEKNDQIHMLNLLNPLYHFIDITREIVIFHNFPSIETFISIIFLSGITFYLGFLVFEKNEKKLAEKI